MEAIIINEIDSYAYFIFITKRKKNDQNSISVRTHRIDHHHHTKKNRGKKNPFLSSAMFLHLVLFHHRIT